MKGWGGYDLPIAFWAVWLGYKLNWQESEMVQWLRVLAALLEDMGLILSTYMEAPTVYNSSSDESYILFGTPQAPDTHVVYRYTCRQKIHIHKLKMKMICFLKINQHRANKQEPDHFNYMYMHECPTKHDTWSWSFVQSLYNILSYLERALEPLEHSGDQLWKGTGRNYRVKKGLSQI